MPAISATAPSGTATATADMAASLRFLRERVDTSRRIDLLLT
jgi:hypothetical protein